MLIFSFSLIVLVSILLGGGWLVWYSAKQRSGQKSITMHNTSFSSAPMATLPLCFFADADYYFETEITDHLEILNVVVIGKVSSGKSSLLNALLGKTRKNSPFKVRAESGVTDSIKILRLNDYIRLIDSPGLDDVNSRQSSITYALFNNVDIGILVVEGSSDATQKEHLDVLRQYCTHVFVVLNKIDQFDKWQPAVLERVIEQWQKDLQVDRIYPTCTFGFDPEVHLDTQLDVRGIAELKADLEVLCQSRWQEILRLRSQKISQAALVSIIAPTLQSIAESGTIARRSPLVHGLLAIALSEIHYLCWQRSPSGERVQRLLEKLTVHASDRLGFCWEETKHPPTFLLDAYSLKNVLVESITLLVGTAFYWTKGKEPSDRDLQPLYGLVKEKLQNDVPVQWADFVTGLLNDRGVFNATS